MKLLRELTDVEQSSEPFGAERDEPPKTGVGKMSDRVNGHPGRRDAELAALHRLWAADDDAPMVNVESLVVEYDKNTQRAVALIDYKRRDKGDPAIDASPSRSRLDRSGQLRGQQRNGFWPHL